MRSFNWVPWLLATCLCLTEARYKMRRPLPPSSMPPSQIFKKSWPITRRMSTGNTIHIGNNYPHKRPILNMPNSFRLRPPPIINVHRTQWKNPIAVVATLPSLTVVPKRTPINEFTATNKVPEYSSEYRPQLITSPQTQHDNVDDDRGPIHTIPAPNLSPADKPYNSGEKNNVDDNDDPFRRSQTINPYSSSSSSEFEPEYGFETSATETDLQRPATNPTPSHMSYRGIKLHESIDNFRTVLPTFLPAKYESTRLLTSSPAPDFQTNEFYLNHLPISRTEVIDQNVNNDHSNLPMQTNLYSSLHVNIPRTALPAPSHMSDSHMGQAPELNVDHPETPGPSLSANQLYDFLNSFPQYSTDQQPQLQQHIFQQQLDQLIQSAADPTTFSQPQMHSFNYDEQAEKQMQQQQMSSGQNYASGRVAAEYNLAPEQLDRENAAAVGQNEEFGYQSENHEQTENNIDYEEQADAVPIDQTTGSENNYNTESDDQPSMSTHFYTTLPNREAAEKLAALAAAGNVNSQLIGQLKKHQQEQEQIKSKDESQQSYDPVVMPNDHNGNYQVIEQLDDIPYETQRESQQQRQRQRYGSEKRYRQRHRQQQIQQEQEAADKHYEQQKFMQERHEQEKEQKNQEMRRPLRIMVPDVEPDETNRDVSSDDNPYMDYEYDKTDSQAVKLNRTLSPNHSISDSGYRIGTATDM